MPIVARAEPGKSWLSKTIWMESFALKLCAMT